MLDGGSHIGGRRVAVQLRLNHQDRARRQDTQQFRKVVRDLVLVAHEEAETRNQPAFMTVARHAAGSTVGGIAAHGCESTDGDQTFDARIERCRINANGSAHRVTEQIDPLWSDQAVLLQGVDRGARVFHHSSHLRPVRVAVIEWTGLAHAAPEAALIEGQDGIAGADQGEDGVQVVVVDPHVAERITVAVQPDHGGQLSALRCIGRIVEVASDVKSEAQAARGCLALLGLQPAKGIAAALDHPIDQIGRATHGTREHPAGSAGASPDTPAALPMSWPPPAANRPFPIASAAVQRSCFASWPVAPYSWMKNSDDTAGRTSRTVVTGWPLASAGVSSAASCPPV